MTILKSLAFTAAPARVDTNPTLSRRAKLLNSLDKQLKLAKDPKFLATRQKWVIGEDGIKRFIERPMRVKPWWRLDNDGKLVLVMKYGAKPLDFDKGKSAVMVGVPEKLEEVINALITATRSGELDTVLERASALRRK